MNKETILEVTKKLIGDVTPYGSTQVDEVRKANLEKMIFIVDNLVYSIGECGEFKDREEYSISLIGKQAHDFLSDLYNALEDYI